MGYKICSLVFWFASRLRVIFAKSRLVGVNVREDFINMGVTFLNCKRGSLPFKYLGIPVGATPQGLLLNRQTSRLAALAY